MEESIFKMKLLYRILSLMYVLIPKRDGDRIGNAIFLVQIIISNIFGYIVISIYFFFWDKDALDSNYSYSFVDD